MSFIIYFLPRFIFLYIELFYGESFTIEGIEQIQKHKTKTNLLDCFSSAKIYVSIITINIIDGDADPPIELLHEYSN